MNRTDFGRRVELQAADWLLRNRGGTLLHRNFRCRAGELDLILEEGRELVFVEVRARVNPMVSGHESVDFRKQRKIRMTIEYFLRAYRGKAHSIRFDILTWDGKAFSHFPNQELCARN